MEAAAGVSVIVGAARLIDRVAIDRVAIDRVAIAM